MLSLICQLNTSTLGYNILEEVVATSTTSAASVQATSLTSWITGEIQNITSTIEGDISQIENDLNNVGNNIANKLADDLGIREWYSLHLMAMCEGDYAPNATAKGASFNTTNCTNRTAMCKSFIISSSPTSGR